MASSEIGRPGPGEFAQWQTGYIHHVSGNNPLAALVDATAAALPFYRAIPEETASSRYAPGKWTVKQVLGHILDAERIFAYRALRIARGDQTPLAPFEQDDYVLTACSDDRPWSDLVDEFEAARRSHVLMLRALRPDDWLRLGVTSGNPTSVRAQVFVLTGHEIHHRRILSERYL